MKFLFGSGPPIRGFSPTEDYTFVVTPQQTTTANTGTTGTLKDCNTLMVSGAMIDSVFRVAFADSLQLPGATFSNLTPAVATISNGVASWVSNGTAQLQVTHPRLGTRTLKIPVSRNLSGAVTTFTSYASTSLAYALSNQVDSAISGLSPSAGTVDAFSSIAIGSSATRNSGLWCAGLVDLTGVPIWQGSTPITKYTGVLVSPRHVLCASHVNPSGPMAWLGSDGVIQTATVVDGSYNHGGGIAGTDLGMVYLGSAIDTSKCKPFSVLPASSSPLVSPSPLPTANGVLSGQTYLPLLHWNQVQELLLLDLFNFGQPFSDTQLAPPIESGRSAWAVSQRMGTAGIVSGDSGSPVFTVIPNDATKTPVLLGCCHTAGGAPNPALNISAINAMMATLTSANGGGTTYTLTQANLSAYPTY